MCSCSPISSARGVRSSERENKVREGGVNRLLVRKGSQLLRSYSNGDLMEGRVDHLTRLNLGRSLNKFCQSLQHFWIGFGIVSLCIGFVVPQTDCSDLCTARTREGDFVLKTILFT